MADKSFGVKELNLLNASGTPTVTSPNNLNLNANTVAISTSCTIGNNLTVTGGTSLSNLLVSGITTFSAGNTVDVRGNFTVSGISTIPQPADSNPMANWTITNNSASAYRFTGPGQSGTEDNPNIYLVRGHRYIFEHNATSSHPIQIRVSNGGSAYTDGITYSEGNNTTTDGNNLIFNVQHDAPAQLFYQCTSHGGMVGNIYIVGQHLANGANNRVLTATSAYGINAESNMTFDGDDLTISNTGLAVNIFESTDNHSRFRIKSGSSSLAQLEFADQDDADAGEIRYDHANNKITIHVGDNTERVGITTDGNVEISDGNLILANGHGIDFSATGNAGNSATMSNELLDDYEEGSWSPTGSWTTITARYTKIGRMVYAGFSLRANTSSGNVTIGGFPFTSANNHAASGGIAWGLCEFNSSGGWLNGSIADGSTSATIRRNNATVLTFGSGQDNMNQNAFLRGTFIYHTA